MDHLSIKLTPFDHQVWRVLKKWEIVDRELLLAVSGGLDSMVMLATLLRLAPLHKCRLAVAHVHHGLTPDRIQLQYRDEAQEFLREYLAIVNLKSKTPLDFFTNKKATSKVLKSEEQFRDFRNKKMSTWLKKFSQNSKNKNSEPITVLAHHSDDLLENYFIRLIRGTGLQGLQSFEVFRDQKLRPLIGLTRKQLEDQARYLKLQWREDPSNKCQEPLRNWLRQHWLPELEKKWPGSLNNVQRSLSLLLTQKLSYEAPELVFHNDTLDLRKFLELGRVERQAILARYLNLKRIRNYSSGHIEEICKRLDNRRADHKFTLLKHEWHINAGRVRVRKL